MNIQPSLRTVWPLLLVSWLAFGCRSTAPLSSHWAADPPGLTGRAIDPAAQGAWLSARDDAVVWVGNDDRFLYLRFNPAVRQRRQVATVTRLSLRIAAASGALDYDYTHLDVPAGGIVAPPVPGATEARGALPPPPPANAGMIVRTRGAQAGEALPADGSAGPRVVFSDKWGDYTYEWRIPLASGWGMGAGKSQDLLVTIRWRTRPLMPERRVAGRRGTPGPSAGLVPEGAGRVGGSLPVGGIAPQASHSASSEIRLRVRLAGQT